MSTEIRTCDVCRLVRGDERPKECRYCSLCDAWLCVNPEHTLAERARAMLASGKTISVD